VCLPGGLVCVGSRGPSARDAGAAAAAAAGASAVQPVRTYGTRREYFHHTRRGLLSSVGSCHLRERTPT